MLLTLDFGNTRIKWAVFQHNECRESGETEPDIFFEKISNVLLSYPKITTIVYVSVRSDADKLLEKLPNSLKRVPYDRNWAMPIAHQYESFDSLGPDRLLGAVGASLMYPGQNCLVIDAGTCVTYDFVTADGVYLGGAISPGLRMRYESMHRFTARLPLLGTASPQRYIGRNTSDCMHSGAVNGLVYEMNGFINEFTQEVQSFIIILTGGDAYFLAKRLKNTIFAHSNFLLESLNRHYLFTTHS